ncbi:hypothetical protein [Lutimonas vermicola]|uniref:Transposase n=1 Tax=Lutimonas vermicola TaxID=414288 RepID=A0ABU9L3L8_9FLAO
MIKLRINTRILYTDRMFAYNSTAMILMRFSACHNRPSIHPVDAYDTAFKTRHIIFCSQKKQDN